MRITRAGRGARAWLALASAIVLAGLMVAVDATAQGLRIVSPAADETVHSNAGTVPVIVAGAAPGQPLRAVLDGEVSATTYTAPAFELHGVSRGTHQLVVEVLDDAGKSRDRAPSVRFFVWQASRLNTPSPP